MISIAARPKRLATLLLIFPAAALPTASAGEPQPAPAAPRTGLVFCCRQDNDLYRSLAAASDRIARYTTPAEAIAKSPPGSAALILADDYPHRRTPLSAELYAAARSKGLRLYVEYPEAAPGVEFDAPRGVRWERGVVASDAVDLGLPKLHLLALHDCQFLPAKAANPALALARVAGFDTAVYGLPNESFPILLETDGNALIAATKLSNFVTARYAPTADWVTLWIHLLKELDPAGAPHPVSAAPSVHPAYDKQSPLPPAAQSQSLDRLANWYLRSRLLLNARRAAEIHELLKAGQEVVPPPAADDSDDGAGDGSHGILEGYASQILPDGSQLQRTPIRADCQAETAAVLALHAAVRNDQQSRRVAENLLDYLYFDSELCQLDRGNPEHPAYGLISWGAVSPAWRVANYGDDNARTLLATMAAAACLDSPRWDEPMLRALWANLRTTGKLGFRGDRIDMPQLAQRGWKAYSQMETVNYSPSFEAYSWACYLWAYARTGDREFLEKTKTAIRMTMEAYPDRWRWGDNLDRSRMLLPLAWLVRVEDAPLHRRWMYQVANDVLELQQPCGAIAEQLSGATTGHFVVPASNEAYGTSETPLIQHDGDPVSDQLYVTNFVLIGLHEAAAAVDDPVLRAAEDKLADYVVRIQARSDAVPLVDGTWFRAFDFHRWDYWSSSGDMGWGAWCAETGWGPAWNGIVLGLRQQRTTLWELTAASNIDKQSGKVKQQLARNQGGPWQSPAQ
ncbi:MAG: hypothetical protein IT424_15475 [Pirellulales bacterium]|nr:hypothetical protein [Pirellulales bacterium]